jgi:hypothetical protein
MRPLCSREDQRRRVWVRRLGLLKRHIRPLATQQLHAGAPMRSTTPIPPEQGSRAQRERMQQQTHPAGLCRLVAVPLTLLAQGAHATVYDPGGVEHPQRAIVLGALLGRVQRLACWTAERPVGLEGKVLSREAASFPRRVAVTGGPYPGAGAGESAACSLRGGMAGANSVVRMEVGSS